MWIDVLIFFFQAEDGIRDIGVTGVQTCALPISLKEIIDQSNKILIMGHHYPDMDAMGAAVGVYDICKSFGKKSNIVLNEVNEAVEIFVDRIKEDDYYEGIFLSHDKAIDLCDENTLVIVVDTHRPSYTECSKLLDISKRIVLIDHHRRGVERSEERRVGKECRSRWSP